MNRSTAPRIPLRMAALALAALAAVAGTALAQDAAAPAPAPPATVDTNGDGVLSAAEQSAAARGAFQRMDGDGDGRITVDEMGAMPGASAAGMPSAADRMKAVDTDGDSVLTAQEHAAASELQVIDERRIVGSQHETELVPDLVRALREREKIEDVTCGFISG